MSIQKHLEKYYGHQHKEEIQELVLDQVKINELKQSDKKLLEQYSSVNFFAMNYCGMSSLNNLPQFPNLEIVYSYIND
jgi:hypothetical protein